MTIYVQLMGVLIAGSGLPELACGVQAPAADFFGKGPECERRAVQMLLNGIQQRECLFQLALLPKDVGAQGGGIGSQRFAALATPHSIQDLQIRKRVIEARRRSEE